MPALHNLGMQGFLIALFVIERVQFYQDECTTGTRCHLRGVQGLIL